MSDEPHIEADGRALPDAAGDEDGDLPLPRVSAPLRWLGKTVLAAAGWKRINRPPVVPKLIMLGVPHTSNWDFILMMATAFSLGVRLSWAGKHTLFRLPLGPLMRALGGIPIDRTRGHGSVDALVEALRDADRMALAIAPEGTRRLTEFWRSGFYHIARLSEVPVVPGLLDYGKREASFGPAIYVTGDVAHDMDRLRAFYAGRTARFPEKFGPVRLRDETESGQA